MSERHCVIIGNGPAANAAALTLRENVRDVRITILDRERHGYYKPHLLPDFTAGKVGENDLFVNPHDFYKGLDIKLRLGQPVVGLDLEKCEILLDHQEIIRYDGLIIAVGAKARIPEPLLVFRDVMMTLKTIADAKAWIERLTRIDSVLLVGGDLTSFAFTNALLSLGKKVHFILNEDSFWPLRFSPKIYDSAADKLKNRGVEVVECKGIKGIAQKSETSYLVETDKGSLTVGAIGAFFGLVPDVRFLARSGLLIERGILVDEYLSTGCEGVYAAGDCAQVYHPELKDYWVSIGYKNAKNLGKLAALNLIGGRYKAEVSPQSIFEVDGVAANTSWWMEF
jgi:NAD(P)H-nitrite reductase large subunit